MSDYVEPAIVYCNMITIRKSFPRMVNSARVRMYDDHDHNWAQRLVTRNKYYCGTDQTYYYNSIHMYKLDYWDEIWLDGVLIYKKSLIKRIFNFFNRKK